MTELQQNPFLYQPNIDNTTFPPPNKKAIMNAHQRSIYEQVIKIELMSENAFIMAWNDFVFFIKGDPKGGGKAKETYFINWLFE